MRPLNAIDAISPALARTKLVLFSPFSFGRTWKIGVTGYMTALGGMFLPWMLVYVPVWFSLRHGEPMPPGFVTGFTAAMSVLSALYLLVYWLCSKLRFAFFGMVLTNQPLVRPMWRFYGPRALPWTLFKVLLGSVLTLIACVPLIHAVRAFLAFAPVMQVKPGQTPDPHFFAALATFYAMFFGLYFLMGLYMWVNSVLSDFIVPSLALEGVSLREAFRRMFTLIRNEPGATMGYIFLKPVLAVAGFMCVMIAFYIALAVVMIALVLICLLGAFLLHLLHTPSWLMATLGILVGGGAYLLLTVYGMGLASGSIYVFLEAYLQFFLGGRYPLLGQHLEQSSPMPVAPSPVAFAAAGWPPPPPQ